MSTTPYETPIPGAPSIAQADLAAKTAYQQALARLNQQRMGSLRQFGYTAQIDPETGVLTGLAVDPHNPYGQYQQTLRGAAQAGDAARNDAIANGLVGGLARQAEDQSKYAFGAQTGQLGNDLQNQLADFQDQQDQAKSAYDSALYTAELQGTQDAISGQNFNPADYSGLPDVGYPQEPSVDYSGLYGGPNTAPTSDLNPAPSKPYGPARERLISHLIQQHISPSQWARQHPVRASSLGISQKRGGNVQVIKQVVEARRRKGGKR